MFTKNTLKRIGLLFAVVGIVSSSASTLISNTVLADGSDGATISSKVSGKVLDHQLYFYLVSCFAQTDMDELKDDEVENWEFLKRGDLPKFSVRGGMYDAALVSCEDGSYMKEAFGRFGFTDPWRTVCSLSFVYDEETGGIGKDENGGNTIEACMNGKGRDGDLQGQGTKVRQVIGLEALLKSAPNGGTASGRLTNSEEYVRKYRTLMKGCDITLKEKLPSNDLSKAGGSNDPNNQLFAIPIVIRDTSGKATTEYWLGQAPAKNDGNKQIPLVATRNEDSDKIAQTISCNQLAVDLRDGLAGAYQTYVNGPGKEDTYDTVANSGDTGESDGEGTSCAIDGVGWIVCPLMNFMANLNDQALKIISGAFLNIDPDLLGADTQSAWARFRDVANILFAILFLIIIYSQITSAGISNYGVKRMLPRLVVAAILINASFFLCQIAVDISNIVGNSINGFLSGALSSNQSGTSAALSNLNWAQQTTVILTAGVVAFAALLLLMGMGSMALLALLMIVLILIARKALIVLLVVTAPIAFVAYLLPNTQDIYKKWMGLFKSLLLIYPIIGLVFGASTLAAGILAQSKDNLVQLSALGVMAIPLLSVPLLLKGALAGTGALGSKLGNLQDKANRKALGNIKQGRSGEAIGAFNANRQSKRAERRAGTAKGIRSNANRMFDKTKLGRAIGGERGQAAAIHAVDKEWAETTNMHQGLYSHSSASDDKLLNDMQDKKLSSEKRAAAAGLLMQRSRGAQNNAVRAAVKMAQSGESDDALGGIQKQMAQDMGSRKPMGLGAGAAAELSRGKLGVNPQPGEDKPPGTDSSYNFDNEIAKRAVSKVSPAGIPDLDPDDLGEILKAAKEGRIQGADLVKLHESIDTAVNDERINNRIDDSARAYLDQISATTTKDAQNGAFQSYVDGSNIQIR